MTITFSKLKVYMLNIYGFFYVFRKNIRVGRLEVKFFFIRFLFFYRFGRRGKGWDLLDGNSGFFYVFRFRLVLLLLVVIFFGGKGKGNSDERCFVCKLFRR